MKKIKQLINWVWIGAIDRGFERVGNGNRTEDEIEWNRVSMKYADRIAKMTEKAYDVSRIETLKEVDTILRFFCNKVHMEHCNYNCIKELKTEETE